MPKVREFSLTRDGSYKLVRVCEERKNALSDPKKITSILSRYTPFDDVNVQVFDVSNLLATEMPKFTLRSGQVYDGYDGKRIVYEVGCDTIIYLMSVRNLTGQYDFFIQHVDGFVLDVTMRSVAEKVVVATKPIRTIAKYEMYFMLGLISSASIPALIMVTGSDIAVSSLMARKKVIAAKDLSIDVLNEYNNIDSYAPTLGVKFKEIFVSQSKVKWSDIGDKLPKTIIVDEKTQAQLAGVIAGKAVLNPKTFTVWTAVFAILSTAVVKSITKSPDIYAKNIDERYRPILEDFKKLDFENPAAAREAAIKFSELIKESGVSVTDREAMLIFSEIAKNPVKLQQSLVKMDNSFRKFSSEIYD